MSTKTLIEQPIAEGRRLRIESNARLDRHFAKRRAEGGDDGDTGSTEEASLRGVPVIGPGCGAGVSPGSDPVAELMSKQPRE